MPAAPMSLQNVAAQKQGMPSAMLRMCKSGLRLLLNDDYDYRDDNIKHSSFPVGNP